MAKLKPRLRRTKKDELVAVQQNSFSIARRRVSRQWRQSWVPIRRFFGKRVDIKVPDGKLGRVLNKRIRSPRYFRESWAELKKVEWPTRHETWRLTWAVIIFATIFSIFTALADFGLSKAVEKVLIK